MAFTLNRRLSTLVDSNGQLKTGKIPDAFITTAHYSANSITDAKLHTSFSLPASALTARDTGDLSEGSNLYYTDARADARIAAADTGDLSEGSNLYYTDARVGTYISGNRTFGNITTTGYLAGPATFTIDPAAVGDNTGTVVIAGNLQVDGTTTTINSTTMTVDDLNITLASGAANAAAANGAGITVDGASATITYDGTNDEWDFNKDINVTGAVVSSANGAITTANGTTARFSVNETGGAITAMDARGSTGNIGTRSNHTLGFLVNDVQKATLTAGGDFTVTNDLKLTTTNPRIDYDNTGSGALRFYSMSAAQERARITSSGKMIIGDVNTDTIDALQIQSPASGGGYGIQLRRDDSNADQQMGRILFGNNTNNDLAQIAAKTDGSTDNSAIFFSTRPTSGALTERMRIDAGGDVSIGTTGGSGRRLDVLTANDYVARFASSDSYAGIIIEDSGSTANYNRLAVQGNNMLFDVNNSTRMKITSAGNVGIGTASPSYKLDVYGTDDITMRIHRPSSALGLNDTCGIGFSQRGDTNTSTSDTRAAIVSTYNGSLHLCTEPGGNLNSNPVDHAALSIIGTTQNVGIGTTSPDYRLHMERGDGSDNVFAIQNTNSTRISEIALVDEGDVKQVRYFYDNGSNRSYQNVNGNGFTVYSAQSSAEIARFGLASNGYTASYFNGNVGIGTDTPSAKLDLRGDMRLDGSAGTDRSIYFRNQGTVGGQVKSDKNLSLWAGNGSGTATQYLTVKEGGNVGIGTTDPQTKFHIVSSNSNYSALISRYDSDDGLFLHSDAQSTHYNWLITTQDNVNKGFEIIPSATVGARDFTTPAFVIIADTGNVGIGTDSPGRQLEIFKAGSAGAYRLKVKGDTGHTGIEIENTSSSNTNILFRNPSYTQELYMDAAGKFHVYNNSLHRFTVDQTGNVGIGTTSPDYLLDIENTSGHAMARLHSGTNGSSSLRLQNDAQHWDVNLQTNDKFAVYDHTAGTQPFTIMPTTGNVGIGTSSPNSRLHVDHSISSTAANIAESKSVATISVSPLRNGSAYGMYFGNDGTNTGYVQVTDGTNASSMNINPFGGNVGIGVHSPFSRLQSGGHTFSGGHGMYTDGRVGMSNHGNLTGLMLASTYNDSVYPEYGLVFVQGPSTSSYNVWSVSPDGPAKGDSLNFHYGSGVTNIHSPSYAKVSFDGNGNIAFGGNLHFKTAQNGSFIGSLNTSDLRLAADGNHIFQTYVGSWGTRMEIRDNGIRFPAGDYGVHTTQEHYTNPSSPGSFSTATNTAYTSSTQYWPDQGEKLICVINARAFTKYIHIKTNLTGNNIMFYFRTKGYFYGTGMEEQLVGGYTYYSGSNMILSKDNKTVAGDTHSGDTYRATDGSLVLKMDVNQTGYTEGKMLVFFHAHAPSTTSACTVVAVTQKDDGTNAF